MSNNENENNGFWASIVAFFEPRNMLAISIVGCSFAIILIFIYIGRDKDNLIQEHSKVILPLLSTWVGAVIAFYFGRENFESASRSITEIATKLTPIEKLKSIPVKSKMILKHNMFYKKLGKEPLSTVKLKDILDQLTTKKRNRLPVTDENDYPKYIIHRSMIDQFLTKKALEGVLSSNELTELSLEDLLKDETLKVMFEESFATIDDDSNLADAKLKMDKIPNCLDVFVTEDGSKTASVVGYLTNLIITENSETKR